MSDSSNPAEPLRCDRGRHGRRPPLARLRRPVPALLAALRDGRHRVATAAPGRSGSGSTKRPGTWRRRCCSARSRCRGCAGCSGAQRLGAARLALHALGALVFAVAWQLLDFALAWALRPRPRDRDLPAARALAGDVGRVRLHRARLRASAARCTPAAPIAPRCRGAAEAALVRAELAAISGKLNPHFLFNTLNSLLILTRKDAGRRRAGAAALLADDALRARHQRAAPPTACRCARSSTSCATTSRSSRCASARA